jgi:general secretion pathway protein H
MQFKNSERGGEQGTGRLRCFLASLANPASRIPIPGSNDYPFPLPYSRLSPGFTLIEILVVIVILAIAAAAVTMAIAGAGGERQLARDAERLRALTRYACEQAELSGREIGISVSTKGYRFSRSEHDVWLPLGDGELRPRKWSVDAAASLARDGEGVDVGVEFPEKPQLVCFASGELTAFRLDLGVPDSTIRYRIDGHADGDVAESIADNRVH